MTATQHFIRYAPRGVEYGPFSDEERADIDAAGPTGVFWRTEVAPVQLALCGPYAGAGR